MKILSIMIRKPLSVFTDNRQERRFSMNKSNPAQIRVRRGAFTNPSCCHEK